MIINKTRIKTKNYSKKIIRPEFIIIHYSAGNWDRIKYHFESGKNSSHFVIDIDGSIDEVVPALSGKPREAYHAGLGNYKLENKSTAEYSFNNISIGIELINFNGNLFDFTPKQYISLAQLINTLNDKYRVLKDPERILGHEHIAGYRGKVDPGIKFNWELLYKLLGFKRPFPKRNSYLTDSEITNLKPKFEKELYLFTKSPNYWDEFNNNLELYARNKSKNKLTRRSKE